MRDVHMGQEEDVSTSGPARPVLSRRALISGAFGALALLAACNAAPPALTSATPAGDQAGPGPAGATPPGPGPASTAAASAEPAPTASQAEVPVVAAATACALPAVVAPTAVPYPGYTQKEPSTGLHVTGEAYTVDLTGYRLKVSGKVEHPLSLSYDDLRCLPKTQAHVRLECPGFFVDEQTLAGPTLATLLALAGPQADATTVKLSSAQSYTEIFPLADAQDPINFLAYEWEGQALPRSHGFPLRGVFPARPGSNWVKWVVEVELS